MQRAWNQKRSACNAYSCSLAAAQIRLELLPPYTLNIQKAVKPIAAAVESVDVAAAAAAALLGPSTLRGRRAGEVAGYLQ